MEVGEDKASPVPNHRAHVRLQPTKSLNPKILFFKNDSYPSPPHPLVIPYSNKTKSGKHYTLLKTQNRANI